MLKQKIIQLRPFGWENHPEEERYKISTLDYLSAQTYNNYALFFRLDYATKPKAVDLLGRGLEGTLSQARHLCSTIEKDEGGGHSCVKKKRSPRSSSTSNGSMRPMTRTNTHPLRTLPTPTSAPCRWVTSSSGACIQ